MVAKIKNAMPLTIAQNEIFKGKYKRTWIRLICSKQQDVDERIQRRPK